LWLTARGAREVDFVTTLIRDWIVDKLTRTASFDERPDRAQIEAALDRIARRIVTQRVWPDDRREPAGVATEKLPPVDTGRTISP